VVKPFISKGISTGVKAGVKGAKTFAKSDLAKELKSTALTGLSNAAIGNF